MKYFISIAIFLVTLAAHCSAASTQQVFTPEAILPAGVDETMVVNPYTGESGKARKGTVAATINNIALLNKLLLKPEPQSDADIKTVKAIIAEIDTLIPSLRALGLFDFFSVDEWISQYKTQPGRTLTAIRYLKQYSNEINPSIQKSLDDIYHTSPTILLKENIKDIK